MNIFKQSLENLQTETRHVDGFDLLPEVPEILSVDDTAYILDVSKQTVQRMIQAGDLKQTPAGKVSKVDLLHYISGHILADLPVL
jgi:hypothetical protein